MTNWTPDLSTLSGPAYRCIAEAIAIDVRTRRLRPGDSLPPQRLLADLLGLNLSTVTRAYREAERRGLIEGHTRRGTVVRARAEAADLFGIRSAASATSVIDLSVNVPACDLRDRSIETALAELQQEGRIEELMRYQAPADWERWREHAVKWLAHGGLHTPPERLVLCAGGQHALSLALEACGTGDIAVEAFTYPGMLALAQERGYRLHALEMDEDGVTPAAILKAARKGIKTLVLSSALQNPTGATMPLRRRQQIADIVQARKLALVEEDVYGAMQPQPGPPISALAPEHCFHVSALSKTVAAGLRFGMLSVPAAHLPHFARGIHSTHWYLSPLAVEIATRLITSGQAARRLAWQRREIAARNHLFDAALPSYAPHRWLTLAGSAQAAAATLASHGLVVMTGAQFGVGAAARDDRHLRLSLGGATRTELKRAAGLMRELGML